MTRLQLALDSDLETALALLAQVHTWVDIVEIGTPLVFREGMHAVHKIHQAYPDLTLLADLKIMDAGEEEARIAFDAGASIVTVMGMTHLETIQGAVDCAREYQGQVMVDMMRVDNLVDCSRDLLNMGCDILCLHTAYDVQSTQTSPYQALKLLREHFPVAQLAIAGGVNLSRLDDILPYQPDVIVVGGAITRAEFPADVAQQIQKRIQSDAGQ